MTLYDRDSDLPIYDFHSSYSQWDDRDSSRRSVADSGHDSGYIGSTRSSVHPGSLIDSASGKAGSILGSVHFGSMADSGYHGIVLGSVHLGSMTDSGYFGSILGSVHLGSMTESGYAGGMSHSRFAGSMSRSRDSGGASRSNTSRESMPDVDVSAPPRIHPEGRHTAPQNPRQRSSMSMATLHENPREVMDPMPSKVSELRREHYCSAE